MKFNTRQYKNLKQALKRDPTNPFVRVRRMTISELNNLPEHITHLKIKYLGAGGSIVIRRIKDESACCQAEYIYETDEVNNLPMSLEYLCVKRSIIPYTMFKKPYGCVFDIRNWIDSTDLRQFGNVTFWEM